MSLDFQIAQLRHLYAQMVHGLVTTKNVASAARGLLGPVIESLERIHTKWQRDHNELESDRRALEAADRMLSAVSTSGTWVANLPAVLEYHAARNPAPAADGDKE